MPDVTEVLWQGWTPQPGGPSTGPQPHTWPPHSSCSFCEPATPSPSPKVSDLMAQPSPMPTSHHTAAGLPTLTLSDTESLLSPLLLLLPTPEPGLLSASLACPTPSRLPLGQSLQPSSQTALRPLPSEVPGLALALGSSSSPGPPHSPAFSPDLLLLHQWPERASQRFQEKATSELSLEAHNITAYLLCARHCSKHFIPITHFILTAVL